jgi:DHA1 family multidrug resistance protein-like MFS transporter
MLTIGHHPVVWRDARSLALVAAIFLSSVAFFANLPLIPLFYLHLSGSQPDLATVGLAVGLPFFVSAAAAPVWGRLTDRFGARSMIVRSSVGLTVTHALMTMVPSVGWLLAVRVVNGLASGFVPAATKALSDRIGAEARGSAMTSVSLARSAGSVLGPGLGGVAATAVGFRPAFAGAAVLAVLAGIMATLAARPHAGTGAAAAVPDKAQVEGGRTGAVVMFVVIGFAAASSAAFQLALPLVFRSMTGDAAAWSGLTFGLATSVSLASAVPWGLLVDKVGANRLLAPVLLAGTAVLGLTTAGGGVSVTIGGAVLYAALTCELLTILTVVVMSLMPERSHGLLFGITHSATQLGAGLGSVAVGPVISHIGGRGAFLAPLIFLLLTGCAVLGLRLARPRRRP